MAFDAILTCVLQIIVERCASQFLAAFSLSVGKLKITQRGVGGVRCCHLLSLEWSEGDNMGPECWKTTI